MISSIGSSLYTCKMLLLGKITKMGGVLHLYNSLLYLGEWFTGWLLRLLVVRNPLTSLLFLFFMETLNKMIEVLVEGFSIFLGGEQWFWLY